MDSTEGRHKRVHALIFVAILAVGIFVRIWHFGTVPGGLNQDEAFAGYEAWSLLKYGVDSAGYRFPVYLTAWGSGMNALNSYLMMPFIAIFGLKVWVIRLPQLIVACLTIPAVYGVVRRLSGGATALLAMFLLAACPWHIMLARWGLESNLAPGFLVFGLYFFLCAFDDRRFLIISAVMYGLSLYCYATVWPFVPLIILLQCAYAMRTNRLEFSGVAVVALLVLAIFALPLFLFLAINYGLIGEVRLPFLSIPKLLYMRASEISLSHIFGNLAHAIKMFLIQSDGLPSNCAGVFGQLYPFSVVFELIGFGFCVSRYTRSLRENAFSGEALVLIQLFAALLLSALIYVNVNRANIIFIPRVMLEAYGIACIVRLPLGRQSVQDRVGRHFSSICTSKGLRRAALLAVCAVYTVSFVGFASYYFGKYSVQISYYFGDGVGEALDAALDTPGKIYVSDGIYYPVVLFYSETPPDDFRACVEYSNYHPGTQLKENSLKVKSFGRFKFVNVSGKIRRDGAYVLSQYDDRTPFIEAGFDVREYGSVAVATS